MLCLRCSRSIKTTARLPQVVYALQNASPFPSSSLNLRTFTSLPPLRPSLLPSTLRPSSHNPQIPSAVPTTSATTATQLDLLPKISAHPALGATQIRCGPRNTFSPSHFVRKRRHGFLSRAKTRKGRATLQRRRIKKRSTLSH